jgi:hypothetical protein
MKNLKFILFTILLFSNSFAQKNCTYKVDENIILQNKNLDAFLQKFESEKFIISNDKNSIPKHVKKQLDCIAKNFDIANPNEKYQQGCIVEENTPSRGLCFLAKSKHVLVMSYATGGIGSSTHFLFIEYNSKGIIDLWTGVGMGIIKPKSLKEISEHIKVFRNRKWGLNTNMVWI